MKTEIAQIWESLLKKAEQLVCDAPIDLHSFARCLGVAEIAPRVIDFDGYLARRPDGRLAIRFRADSTPARARFTIAHEIAHILIAKELGKEIQSPVARSYYRDDEEERLANRVASELLMPAKSTAHVLQSLDVSWDTIQRIARMFKVSLSAAALRVKEIGEISYLEISPARDLNCGPVIHSRLLRNLLFDSPPCVLLKRLADELNQQPRALTQHSVVVLVDGQQRSFQLLGWVREKGDSMATHFFGWQPNDDSYLRRKDPCRPRYKFISRDDR
ncbi:MAG: hypothetical protein JWN70_4456 [Planctomycetaceae bacterium]|nr:hypothetical protein [Planctomycetaceae bacterium]